ncbi:MAG: ABC transporter permease [Acidimicrobiales bacterium]
MRPQFASEVLKLRSTRTAAGLLGALVALVVVAVALHGYGLPADELATSDRQLSFLVGWGAVLGSLFAALCGALSFTAEVRHGTIRPTLIATPRRGRVVLAKLEAAYLAGTVMGLGATCVAAVAGRVALDARGVAVMLDGGDYAFLIAGGAASAGLWAVIGVGVGAVVRAQVPTVVGLLAWVLLVEGQVLGNAPGVGRLAPGPLGQAMSGLRPGDLVDPALAAVLLATYAVGAGAAGWLAATRTDVA